MELTEYCDGVAGELSTWRGKVDEVVKRLDHVSSGDKAKVYPHVNELHMVMEELDDRIKKLRTQCPTSWEPEKAEMEGKFFHLRRTWEGVWENVSPGEIGL
jgi:predicted nuclease with TOPRIM domain